MCLSNCRSCTPVINKYRSKHNLSTIKTVPASSDRTTDCISSDRTTTKSVPVLKDNAMNCSTEETEKAIKISRSKTIIYRTLFQTTQPAHLLIACTAVIVGYLLYPKSHSESKQLLNFLYLGSFGTYLGTQIWMTFVSGLSLYFSLPRHHFGNVQKVLFPKYFMLNTLLNVLTLTIYIKIHRDKSNNLQIFCLAISLLINFIVRLHFAPTLLKYMEVKNKMEENVGVGMEIGTHNSGPLKNCVHYNKLYKNFKRYHMIIAIGNIITMACTVFHLFYLSSKIDLIS